MDRCATIFKFIANDPSHDPIAKVTRYVTVRKAPIDQNQTRRPAILVFLDDRSHIEEIFIVHAFPCVCVCAKTCAPCHT